MEGASDKKSDVMSLKDFYGDLKQDSLEEKIKQANAKAADAKKLYDAKQPTQALVEYKKALAIDDENFEALKWQAVIEKKLDFKAQKSKETTRQVYFDELKADPILAEIAYRGEVRKDKEQYQDALQLFNKVIEQLDVSPQARLCRAHLYLQLSKFEFALRDLIKAVRLRPTLAEDKQLLDKLEDDLMLIEAERAKKVDQYSELTQSLAKDAKSSDYLLRAQQRYKQAKKTKLQDEHVVEDLILAYMLAKPSSGFSYQVKVLQLLIEVHLYYTNAKEAADWFERLFELRKQEYQTMNPAIAASFVVADKNNFAKQLLACADANAELNPQFALDCLDQACKFRADTVETLLDRLIAHDVLYKKTNDDKHLKQMMDHIGKIMQLNPDALQSGPPKQVLSHNIKVLFDICHTKCETNQHASAIALLEQAAQIFKLDYRFEVELGVAKLSAGQREAAKIHFENANKLKPNDFKVLKHLESVSEKPVVVPDQKVEQPIAQPVPVPAPIALPMTAKPKPTIVEAKKDELFHLANIFADDLRVEALAKKELLAKKAEEERDRKKEAAKQLLPFKKDAAPLGKKDPSKPATHSAAVAAPPKKNSHKNKRRSQPSIATVTLKYTERAPSPEIPQPPVRMTVSVPIKSSGTGRTWKPLPPPTMFAEPQNEIARPADSGLVSAMQAASATQVKPDQSVVLSSDAKLLTPAPQPLPVAVALVPKTALPSDVKTNPQMPSLIDYTDPSQVLKALYFVISSKMALPVDFKQQIAAHKKIFDKSVTAKAINAELRKAFNLFDPTYYFKKLNELGLLDAIFPTIAEQIMAALSWITKELAAYLMVHKNRAPLEIIFVTLVVAAAKLDPALDEQTMRRIVNDNSVIDQCFSALPPELSLSKLYASYLVSFDTYKKLAVADTAALPQPPVTTSLVQPNLRQLWLQPLGTNQVVAAEVDLTTGMIQQFLPTPGF